MKKLTHWSKTALTATVVGLLLTACGGGSSSSKEPPPLKAQLLAAGLTKEQPEFISTHTALHIKNSDEYAEVLARLPENAVPAEWQGPDFLKYNFIYLEIPNIIPENFSLANTPRYHTRIEKIQTRPTGNHGSYLIQAEACGIGSQKVKKTSFALYRILRTARPVAFEWADRGYVINNKPLPLCKTQATTPNPPSP